MPLLTCQKDDKSMIIITAGKERTIALKEPRFKAAMNKAR
jgi:hypothetical protein